MSASEKLQEYKSFKEQITKDAEHNLREVFPRKALELEALLKLISAVDLSSTHSMDVIRGAMQAKCDGQEEKTPVTVPCNAPIVEMTEKLKPELVFVIDQINTVKMWIQLNIPKTQDGNNFAASIKSDTLSELIRIETDVAALYESILWYYVNRAKLITQCLKTPRVADHQQTVVRLDNKQLEALYMVCAEMRNIYCCLNDMILKNWENLKKIQASRAHLMMY